MITPAEIAEYGERHVEAWLTAKGYRCYCSRPDHGVSDIEAHSGEENMFVHVVPVLTDHLMPELSTEDRRRVVSRAMILGFDAWLAQLRVSVTGDLLGEIEWVQLNH